MFCNLKLFLYKLFWSLCHPLHMEKKIVFFEIKYSNKSEIAEDIVCMKRSRII